MSGQERKLDAAEYVIGTMSAVERTAFEASIETDITTREDVLFWERTFGSLNASVAPEAPLGDLWNRIADDLPGGAASGGEKAASETAQNDDVASGETAAPTLTVVSSQQSAASDTATSAAIAAAANDANKLRRSVSKLRRSVSRWRTWAIAASIATLGLGGVILNSSNNPFAPPTEQLAGGSQLGSKEYIAVVNANGDQPSLVINIDAATGDVTVRSIGVERPEGKSLEVWYVPDGQTPVSVGLVGEGNIDLKGIQAKDGDLLAISVEPPGGSPTGTATGDVIYTGKLIENVNPN